MKIAIIGAGNMGGAIARGIASSNIATELVVANRSQGKLDALKKEFPAIRITTSNTEAVDKADVLILAVKPHILPQVCDELCKNNEIPPCVISVVAGYGLRDLKLFLRSNSLYFYVIPNTAITVGHGMTFVSHGEDIPQQCVDLVCRIFGSLGDVKVIEEDLMPAATALCSCGIAYVFKYVQAMVQAGVQIGFKPEDALRYSLSTIDGAVTLLKENHTEPTTEINRVTTPGGMTIKGVNSLEHNGFTSAVINAILAPLDKK